MSFNLVAKFQMDGTGFTKGAEKVKKETDDIAKAAKKTGKKVGDGIKKGAKKAEKSLEDLQADARKEFSKIAKQGGHAGTSIGSGFKKGADKAKTEVKGIRGAIGKAFKGAGGMMVGALGLGAIGAAAREAISFGADIRDRASATGVDAGEWQRYASAAKMSGIEVNVVGDALKDLAKNTSEALDFGSTNKIWAFEQFGIQMDEIKEKNPSEIFKMIAREVEQMNGELSASKAKALEELMGTSGHQSLHLMRSGLDDLMDRADRLGLVLEDSLVQELGAASDRMEELKQRSMPILANMAVSMASVGQSLVGGLDVGLKKIEEMSTKFLLWKNNLSGEEEREAGEVQQDQIDRGKKAEDKQKFEERFLTQGDKVGEKTKEEMTAQEASMVAATEKRKEAATRLAKLQEEERQRAFEKLPAAQKALILEQRIAEEKKKQLELEKNIQKTRASDKARADLGKAKAARSEVSAQHGNVDEVFEEVAKLQQLEDRKQELEKDKAIVTGAQGEHRQFTHEDAAAELEASKMQMSQFVAADPNTDFVQLEKDAQRLEELKAERQQFRDAGDVEGERALDKDIQAQRATMKADSGMDTDKQRQFLRLLQDVKNAEQRLKDTVDAKESQNLGDFKAANMRVDEAQAENLREIEETQARINKLREQYGADAVAAATKAQTAVSQAELNLEEQSASLREQFSAAKAELQNIQSGETGIAAGVKSAFQRKDEAKLQMDLISPAAKAKEEGVGITEDSTGFGFTDEKGQFHFLAESREAAEKYWNETLPQLTERRRAEFEESEKIYNAKLLEQEKQAQKAKAKVTQLGNQLAVQEAGGEATQAQQLESKAKEEELRIQQAKLQEEAQAEKNKIQTPSAGEPKFGTLARLGGTHGNQSSVLRMTQKQLNAQLATKAEIAKMRSAMETLAGTK